MRLDDGIVRFGYGAAALPLSVCMYEADGRTIEARIGPAKAKVTPALLRGACQALLLSGALLRPGAGYALPSGGVVSGGSATITTSGATTTITQDTSKAIIDWQSFNVGSGEKVNFVQPGSSSITLNRIHDASPSVIDGQITANGKVWLVNSNGVFFGANAQVNVAGIVATTADIDNDQFIAGNYTFNHPGNPSAQVINNGTITVQQAGLAAFVAPGVVNNGVITARLGKVALASGDTFALDMYGDGLVSVAISNNVASQLVQNAGAISATGGQVLLTAAAASNIVSSLVNNTGIIEANAAGTGKGGEIILFAQGSNAVTNNVAANKNQSTGTSEALNSGTLEATGYGTGQTGGTVELLADNVGVMSTSVIDASGDAGGGIIRIGGDFHGEGTTATALHTIVQTGSLTKADAITSGNGGKVTVWADDWTKFAGTISAHGGSTSGDGGYVETSGKQTLTATGTVDASAPHGNAGTWLLDPNNVVLSTADLNESGDPNFTMSGTGTIDVAHINADLSAGTNVTVTASGSIEVASNISKTAGGDATLDLEAGTDITVDSNVSISSTTGKLNVTFDADTAQGGGAIVMNTGSSITTNGGDITLSGVGDATNGVGVNLAGAALSAEGGGIAITGTGYAGTTTSSYGIELQSGADVQTTGVGTITLDGIGGSGSSGTAGNQYGVLIMDGVGGGSTVSTVNGSISITGQGGSDIAGSNYGVYLANSTVQAAGTGAVGITGTGGNGGGDDKGVYLQSAGGKYYHVRAVDGNVAITGTAGTGGWFDSGIVLTGGANPGASGISSSGSGNIMIIGTGADTGNGVALTQSSAINASGTGSVTINAATSNNTAFGMDGATNAVSTYSGDITITAANTALGNGNPLNLPGGGSDTIGGALTTGHVTLIADEMTIGNGESIRTSGTVTLKPYTASTTVGVNDAGSTLNLTSGMLDNVTAGSITIGDANDTGAMALGSYTNWAAPVTFLTKNTSSISVTGNQTASGNGSFTFTGGPVSLGANLTAADHDITFNPAVTLTGNSTLDAGSGTITFGSTVNGAHNLTANAGMFGFAGALGGGMALGAVSLTSTGALTLPSIDAATIFAETTGAAADLVIAAGKQLAASGAGDAITLIAGRDFVNDSNSAALSTPSGRWLVYSTNPSADTDGGLTNSFVRYSCAYGGACPTFASETGNGFLYRYAPTLTITANDQNITAGDAAPAYTYAVTGYLSAADQAADRLTGSVTFGSTYNAASLAGNYTISESASSLASALGYDFTYANGLLAAAAGAGGGGSASILANVVAGNAQHADDTACEVPASDTFAVASNCTGGRVRFRYIFGLGDDAFLDMGESFTVPLLAPTRTRATHANRSAARPLPRD